MPPETVNCPYASDHPAMAHRRALLGDQDLLPAREEGAEIGAGQGHPGAAAPAGEG